MYICVIFEKSKTIKIVPIRWWQHHLSAVQLTYGIRPNQIQKVFYCDDELENANFNLPLSNEFQENVPRCYSAYIFKFFGSYLWLFLKLHAHALTASNLTSIIYFRREVHCRSVHEKETQCFASCLLSMKK